MNMFFYILFVYCGIRFDFMQILKIVNNIDNIAKKENRIVKKSECQNLKDYDVKFVFSLRKTLIFYIPKFDLAIKRAILVDDNNEEGEISVYMNHKNIVTTYITFRQRYRIINTQWLVMEHLKCDMVRISDKNDAKKYKICDSICDALVYLHTLNIVHLDVKPNNICTAKLNNDNMKIKAGLQQMYKTISNNTYKETDYNYFYDLMINHKYIKSQDKEVSQRNKNQTNAIDISIITTINNYEIVYKLIDFGLSRRYKKNDFNETRHNLYGTLPNIAYEIYKHKSFTLKTYVFNFGALCFFLFYNKNLNSNCKKGHILDYCYEKQ